MISKGPFWLITEPEYHILSYPVNVSLTETPSHKSVWRGIAGIYSNRPWNYYPRGRVEIRKNRAVIFLNPACIEWDGLEDALIRDFNLFDMEIVYKADNSAHYQYESC